jgi:CheY-like chemotaxis protein
MLKVLIAEDELMIADMTADFLVESGYEVCGVARTVSKALELAAACDPDLALIDMRLAEGGLGTQVAARLRPFGGLGVLYASGNAAQADLTATDGHAYITKPYTSADLLRALVLVRSLALTGKAAPPFPRRFQVLGPAILDRAGIGCE